MIGGCLAHGGGTAISSMQPVPFQNEWLWTEWHPSDQSRVHQAHRRQTDNKGVATVLRCSSSAGFQSPGLCSRTRVNSARAPPPLRRQRCKETHHLSCLRRSGRMAQHHHCAALPCVIFRSTAVSRAGQQTSLGQLTSQKSERILNSKLALSKSACVPFNVVSKLWTHSCP